MPNFEHAFIGIKKLENYCLNPIHPVGKNKAFVFKSALGFTDKDAKLLKEAILKGLNDGEISLGKEDQYGKRYIVDVEIRNLNQEAVVRTAWIIKHDEDFPRLTTCYVK